MVEALSVRFACVLGECACVIAGDIEQHKLLSKLEEDSLKASRECWIPNAAGALKDTLFI